MTAPIEHWRSLANAHELVGNPTVGKALNEACDEIERLRQIATVNGGLYRSAEGDVSAVHVLVARWEQDVANLYAANEEEALPTTRTIRYIRAEEIERLIGELRDALSAPHSPAAGRSGVSAATEVTGGAGEAQEGSR